MNVEFTKETNIRSFMDQKLSSFGKYTTLPFINQMEMVLNYIPTEVAKIFMMKLNCDKNSVLDFCESPEVQNALHKYRDEQNKGSLQSKSKMDSDDGCDDNDNRDYDDDDSSDSTIRNQSPEHLAESNHNRSELVNMSLFDELIAGPSRAGGTGRVSGGRVIKPRRGSHGSDQSSNSNSSYSSNYSLRSRNVLRK